MFIAYKSTSPVLDSAIRQIIISDCKFINNSGNGAAMETLQLTHYRTPNFKTLLNSCIFKDNFTPSKYTGPTLDFISTEVSVTNSTFKRSSTTAIALRNSYLHFSGDVHFESNKEKYGGALNFVTLLLCLQTEEQMYTLSITMQKKAVPFMYSSNAWIQSLSAFFSHMCPCICH